MLEDGMKTLKTITYDSVDQLMQGIAKRPMISHQLFYTINSKAKHFTIPEDVGQSDIPEFLLNKMKTSILQKNNDSSSRTERILCCKK